MIRALCNAASRAPHRRGRAATPSAMVALALGSALLASPDAFANGNHTHIGISLQAIALLPPGPLRDFVSDPALRPMLINGTVFPDGGYATSHPYGEAAHWEPTQRTLAKHVLAACPQPLQTQACREKLAFLFGMASHGMADQVFDSLFMEAAKVHDAKNWSDGLTDSFDSSTDVLWVASHGGLVAPASWMPMDEILATYKEMKLDVAQGTIEDGQTLILVGVLTFGNNTGTNPQKVQQAKDRYPWGAAHLDDPHTPGSPPCEARVVAAYWQHLWAEWVDGAAPSLEVLATMPGHGGGGAAAQPADPASTVAVVLSRGLDQDSVSATSLEATAGGKVLDAKRNLFYGQNSHVLRLLPKAPWPAGELTLRWAAGGLRSFDGVTMAKGGEVTVQVGAANEVLPGTPPPGWSLSQVAGGVGADGADSPDVASPPFDGNGGGDAGAGATKNGSSGCSASPMARGAGQGLWPWALAALLLVARRVRRLAAPA